MSRPVDGRSSSTESSAGGRGRSILIDFALANPYGGKYRQMMIYLDPAKLRSVGLSLTDVAAALKRANIVMGSGTAKMGSFDYQIHCVNTLPQTTDIDEVPLAVRDGKPLFVRDVGYAKDDASIQYNIVHVDGKRSVYCPVMREPGVNTIRVVDQAYKMVREDVPKMKDRGEIPKEAKITLVADQSSYIRTAMSNLLSQVGLGAILVAIVVAVFLRRLLPTLAIVAVIGLSLLIGGLGFAFTGNSINVMTLGGVALAVGSVVNVGIVIVENVIRHLQLGKSPLDAAREGSNEVAMPVLAGTVTTLAVFIPAIFLTGMIRDLFAPLSAAAALTIGASYFIGMTVVPAFCVRFIRARAQGPDSPAAAADATTSATVEPRASTFYGRLLSWAIKARWVVILLVVALVGASLVLLPGIGTQLFPEVVAAVLVYLVMMAQFRSFLDPLIIMLAVPLGFSGVLAVLSFTGTRIDIQSLIGAMMMIGVVVNNSILLVEFANQLCQRGSHPKQAALAAAEIRLRPILMTTLALVASMLPLSIQFAPGGEAMIPLARAFIGGVIVSTLLTLFLVPCVYTLLKRAPVPAAAE